jgi:hypothetical protein
MDEPSPGTGPDADKERGAAPRPAARAEAQPSAVSLRGIQLVVRTLADAPLHHTAREFPHVINKLADAWERCGAFEAVIDELLFTDRPCRRGFPPQVLRELTDLRCLHERRIGNAGYPGTSDAEPTVLDAQALRRRLTFLPPPQR